MRRLLLATTFLCAATAAHAQSCAVPSPAAATGYTTETFNGVGLGSNFVPFQYFGTEPNEMQVAQNSNGSLTVQNSGDGYGAQAQSTAAFGGGGYFQATMVYPPTPGIPGGAFWANGLQGMTGQTGETPEIDIAENDNNSDTALQDLYLSQYHVWTGGSNQVVAVPNGTYSNVPAGTNWNQPQTYGMLWIPATATTQGSMTFYFNGQQVGATVTWSQGSPLAAIDAQQIVLILGTGGSPTTYSGVQVWQNPATANDTGTAASAASSAEPCGATAEIAATPTSTAAAPAFTSGPTPQQPASPAGQICAQAAVAPGTRDPTQTPFASTSVFNLPIGSGAQWTPNAQLANSNVVVNTNGNYNEPIYTGTAADPLVTVSNNGSAQGAAPATYQVHIPAGAQPSQPTPGDNLITVDDTTTGQWCSFGEFSFTSATTAVAGQGSCESDSGSGIAFDNSNQDEGVGTLRESDLQAGTINHMLRINLPNDMLQSVSANSNQLAANAWPQTAEDGFGPTAYTGTVPYGVTIGIPATAVEPADVAANPGANMLWQALQDHGATIRDSGGSGNNVTFQTDQNVNPNDPLIQGMEQLGSQIMAQAQILANQGPNSVNGGGTPIVPLDPPLSNATGGNSAQAETICSAAPTQAVQTPGSLPSPYSTPGGADTPTPTLPTFNPAVVQAACPMVGQ